MTILITTLLVVITVAVLAYPFVARRVRAPGIDDPAGDLAEHLRRSRDRVYEEIRALQQEYFLSAMTQEEYQQRLQEARLQAATLLRDQQRVQETIASIEEAVDHDMAQQGAPKPEDGS